MRQEQHYNKKAGRSDGSRKRSARAAGLVDQRLRQTSAYRKPATDCSRKVRNSEGEVFLISVEATAMFGDEHSPNRSRLDCAKKKAGGGDRNKLVQIIPGQRRQLKRWNALRHRTE